MKKLISIFTLSLLFATSLSQAQTWTGDIRDNLFSMAGFYIPGTACKTRTNNDATVRNLALGVLNRDSDALVALNCGWMTPTTWARDNNSHVFGNISARFTRTAGTPLSEANDAICFITAVDISDPSPNQNSFGTLVGSISPSFFDLLGNNENRGGSVSTQGISYPFMSFANDGFAAFCRLPKGVRINGFVMSAQGVE